MGEGDVAGELLRLLDPVLQADTREKADIYRVEPYVVCADIYSVPPHLRRGGWTWYTGSAAWLYRLGIEGVLGLHKHGDALSFDPVIPAAWDGFELTYRYGATRYQIQVSNPNHCQRGVRGVDAGRRRSAGGIDPADRRWRRAPCVGADGHHRIGAHSEASYL